MARRNYFNKSYQQHCNPITNAQLDREIYVNSAYLKKTMNNNNNYDDENQQQQPPYHHTSRAYLNVREPDLYRDDASILNTNRKRSNSLSSLHNPDYHTQSNINNNNNSLLILPSPTSADYLRNRTRENALINVVMNPTRTPNDFEISQILYDDMAYRQLRKDSEAHKIAQIKAVNNLNMPNLVNITTLPIHLQANNRPGGANYLDYYKNEIAYDPRPRMGQESAANSVKTVKMIKQKDASSKNMKYGNNNSANSNRSSYQYIEQANRFVPFFVCLEIEISSYQLSTQNITNFKVFFKCKQSRNKRLL